jgi:hypothetical protein
MVLILILMAISTDCDCLEALLVIKKNASSELIGFEM